MQQHGSLWYISEPELLFTQTNQVQAHTKYKHIPYTALSNKNTFKLEGPLVNGIVTRGLSVIHLTIEIPGSFEFHLKFKMSKLKKLEKNCKN